MRYDLLIAGGHVLDPAAGYDGRLDVAVSQGRIAAVDAAIPVDAAARVVDAGGALVLPGLVDFHTHVFPRYKDDNLYASRPNPVYVAPAARLPYADKLRAYFAQS